MNFAMPHDQIQKPGRRKCNNVEPGAGRQEIHFQAQTNRAIFEGNLTRLIHRRMSERIAKNAASVDVEDHAEAFSDVVDRTRGERFTSRGNTRRLLNLLARRNGRATFFVLGWAAEPFPARVPEIAAGGHEWGDTGLANCVPSKAI